eukprot:173004-Prorocentrum_minimum.AAC.2
MARLQREHPVSRDSLSHSLRGRRRSYFVFPKKVFFWLKFSQHSDFGFYLRAFHAGRIPKGPEHSSRALSQTIDRKWGRVVGNVWVWYAVKPYVHRCWTHQQARNKNKQERPSFVFSVAGTRASCFRAQEQNRVLGYKAPPRNIIASRICVSCEAYTSLSRAFKRCFRKLTLRRPASHVIPYAVASSSFVLPNRSRVLVVLPSLVCLASRITRTHSHALAHEHSSGFKTKKQTFRDGLGSHLGRLSSCAATRVRAMCHCA